MSEPFLAEVKIVGFTFAPRGWAFCDGQILPINQNQSLFSLLGTTYGGDGRTSFGLPDLRGRTPIHVGQADGGLNYKWGQKGGEERHTVLATEMPVHTHELKGDNTLATQTVPVGSVLARGGSNFYGEFGTATPMGAGSVANAGANQGHDNMQPYLVLNYCIALQGLFPSRNSVAV